MTTYEGGYGEPGVGATLSTTPREIIWGACDNPPIYRAQTWFDSAAADAGNTPTSHLRPGLLLGKLSATGKKHLQWDPLATDGSKDLSGVLAGFDGLRMTDYNATASPRWYYRLVRAPLLASQLLIKGSAFVGHAYEYLARRQLHMAGFVLDDDPMGYLTGLVPRVEWDTTVALGPTAAQTGTTFYLSNAAAVAVTLPTIKAGLKYTFVRTADEELAVTATGALFVGNSSTSGTITFTTTGQQIGAAVAVEAMYIASAGTLKWVTTMPWAFFGTGTASMAYAIT